jgi:hypothetical protein
MAEQDEKLITFAYLRQEIDVPQNIPDTDFDRKIKRAQERLRMIMGDSFYQDFVTQYKASTKQSPMSDPYQRLYDPYIKQFVAHQTFVHWTLEANFKPTRSGIRVHTEDNSDAASDAQMSVLLKDRKQEAEYYAQLLMDFLNENHSDYALYNFRCSTRKSNPMHISAIRRHDHKCTCRKCRR